MTDTVIRHASGEGRRVRPVPWIFYLLLTLSFFLAYRNLSVNPQGVHNEDASSDQFSASVSGSPVTHAGQVLLAVGALITLIRYRAHQYLRVQGVLGYLFLGFNGWALLSVLWAQDMQLTVQRLTGLTIITLAAAAVAYRLSMREIVLWICGSTAVFLVFGIGVEVFFGTFQPMASGFRFAGSLGPNDQGVECGILMLSAAAAADMERRWRTQLWGCAVLGFIFLVLTGSRTALAATLGALLIYELTVRSRRTKAILAMSACLLGCMLVAGTELDLLPNLKSAVLLGRDDPDSVESFSGRTAIWKDLEPYVLERPLLGLGYGGFWTPAHIEMISDREKHGVPNGHSTYLDYFLTLGAVGVLLYAGLLLLGIWNAFRLYRRIGGPTLAFCGSLLSFCALHGLLESGSAERGLQKFLCVVVLVRLSFLTPSEFDKEAQANVLWRLEGAGRKRRYAPLAT